MKLDRRLLDEYLDGQLAAAQAAEVELGLRTDAAAARLLARLRSERALRYAALQGHEPSAEESAALAAAWLEEFNDAAPAPVARIGPRAWMQWGGAIAAGLALMIGSFMAGRGSVDTQATNGAQSARYYAPDNSGELREYTSASEAKAAFSTYLAMVEQSNGTQVAEADTIAPHGSF